MKYSKEFEMLGLTSVLRIALIILFTTALASCGGGGGSSKGSSGSATPPPPPPPPPPLPTADPATGFTFDFRLRFLPDPPNVSPRIYASVATGDFNGDGRSDLAASLQGRHELEVFLQKPDGTLAEPLVYPLSTNNYMPRNMLILNDFNNDGADDVVFEIKDDSGNGKISILLSRLGQQPLTPRELSTTKVYVESGSGPNGYAALDFNDDGNADIVEFHSWKTSSATLANCVPNLSCPHLVVYAGNGRGDVGAPYFLPWIGSPDRDARDFFVQDIDMDGRDDVVFSSFVGNLQQYRLYAMKRNSDGSLSDPAPVVETNVGDAPAFFGDLNSDGRTDLIYGATVHFRESSGRFGTAVRLGLRYNMESYWNVLGDFDGNGQTDIVNHQFEGFQTVPYFVTYLQKGGKVQSPFFRYDPPTNNFVSPDKRGRQAFAVGDFNGDGCRDIAVAAQYSGLLFLEGRNCIRAVR